MPVEPTETWIFGYGSLMWNPGFAFAEARRARLTGYHRAFCIYSIHYRGTVRQPGLVLGLDRGGVCEGIAFRIAPEQGAAVLDYVRRRELIYGVYREALVPVDLHPTSAPPYPESIDKSLAGDGGRTAWAVAYIAERAHPAYAGCLPLVREAQLIRRSAGFGGTNLDYLFSTLRHLTELGIREPRLDRLVTLTGALAASRSAANGNGGSATVALTRAWAARTVTTPRTVRDNRFGFRAKLG
ncbi:gamma-glutamylcyclotransferase [Hyphomicrobium sp.]|uniref:gamma-glutamylcyclotransferase n=1 Tax=Hyphomicrobium sp. TaxID=82 RepID=UPI0025BEF4E9|nr:gamma-glutamylcyclotransferase [Hyphomicrobium sp.]MCC7253026.1 gamma-glutamylcyclotransferase [Hyphomicrobium sp.]